MASTSQPLRIVYLQNTSTGTLHKSVDGMTMEECNIDAVRRAGHLVEWLNYPYHLELHMRKSCQHCHPRLDEPLQRGSDPFEPSASSEADTPTYYD